MQIEQYLKSYQAKSCNCGKRHALNVSHICVQNGAIDKLPEFIKEFNAKSILIRRDNIDELEYGNHADDDVFNYDYDIEINNSGTLEDLTSLAIQFCEQHLREGK